MRFDLIQYDCQAQAEPQLNLAAVSSSLQISTPPTHPTTHESSELATSSSTCTIDQLRVNLNPNLNLNLHLKSTQLELGIT